jgi:mycothiol synthase
VTSRSTPHSAEPPANTRISGGPLSAAEAAGVLELADAARQSDGVEPLSEQALLQVRHGSEEGARDLVLLLADDTVAGYAHLDPASEASGDMSGELTVHPAHRRRGYGTALVSALAAGTAGHVIRLWAHGDLPAAAALAAATGFTRFRALWQMRMSLAGPEIATPVLPTGITVRTFRPGQDEQAWLRVNRRAFAHHPEQGSWSLADLELREEEPWFDPAGFFLAERDGELAGFHWTKVQHFPVGTNQPDFPVGTNQPDFPAGTNQPAAESGGSPIGEVYIVGVDPAAQGGGLGRALTLIGLAYLQRRGLDQVMLYVDEENTAAVRMYSALGFARWSTDVMYRRAVPS